MYEHGFQDGLKFEINKIMASTNRGYFFLEISPIIFPIRQRRSGWRSFCSWPRMRWRPWRVGVATATKSRRPTKTSIGAGERQRGGRVGCRDTW